MVSSLTSCLSDYLMNEGGGFGLTRSVTSDVLLALPQPACRGHRSWLIVELRSEGRVVYRRCHEARPKIRARSKVEARGNQPYPTEGLLDLIPVRDRRGVPQKGAVLFVPISP